MSALPAQPLPSAARQNAVDAASQLFADYSESIYGYCLRQLGSRSEAEDAVQTTFLHAFRALGRGVVPECESAWLTTIAKNVCHSQRRTVERRGPVTSDVDLNTIALAQKSDDEEDLLIGLSHALASMPDKQRRALVRREWQGIPAREIASELGITAAATHALLTRARQSFSHGLALASRPVVGVVWLIVELRSHLKALVGGISTKAAATSIAVVGAGVGIGGVAVDRSLAESKNSPAPVRAAEEATVRAAAKAPTVRVSSAPSAAPRPLSTEARMRPTEARMRRVEVLPAQGIVFDRRTEPTLSVPYALEPKVAPTAAGNTLPPTPELPVNLPVAPPQLPEVVPPTQLVPPVAVPPVPPVGLPSPSLPPVDLPSPPLPTEDVPLPDLTLP